MSQHSSTSYFDRVLTPAIKALLNSTSELTLFLPVNDAWESLPSLERLYLESEFATDDLNLILNAHAVREKKVKWSDSFNPEAKRKALDLFFFPISTEFGFSKDYRRQCSRGRGHTRGNHGFNHETR